MDRSGRHFELVLNFLRDGSVPLPEDHRELDEVLKEAQYYRVQGLVQHCLGVMQVNTWISFFVDFNKMKHVQILTCFLYFQKQKDVFESVCRIPMITSAKEEQRMIATCRKVNLIQASSIGP